MGKKKGSHLTIDDRRSIEEGLFESRSARWIATRIGVSASTVTREVSANRTVRVPDRKGDKASAGCLNRGTCERRGTACKGCKSSLCRCKDCKTRRCTESCPDFELRVCPETERWPYVCRPKCAKRGNCTMPKCSYRAVEAQASYEERLASSRAGADLTPEELRELDELVTRLAGQGHSFEAIVAEKDPGVCARTLYRYQEQGLINVPAASMPEKARRKPRVKKRDRKSDKPAKTRVDRTGRTYDDFRALPLEDIVRAVQCDSVCGFAGNRHDILSMMHVPSKFQLYVLKEHGLSGEVPRVLDAIEAALGSPEAFEAVFGILLCDRGTEFDDWEAMESSSLVEGAKRCTVYYCDTMNSNQKSECERNHRQLRRILPKGRTNMDMLTADDVALCCSHVNSYHLKDLGGSTPFDRIGDAMPECVLDLFGVTRIDADDVVLLPSLVPHAVEQ